MNIIEFLKTDEEMKKIREKYKEKYHESPPPFNIDEYKGLTDYINQLREAIKESE